MSSHYDYGLPETVKYCKKCVMPNTRPASSNEYKHTIEHKHTYLQFDDEGICSACHFNEKKWNQVIDWKKREEELLELLDRFRSKDGSYDCIVPGSGGKDSCYTSHLLKYKYNMHPLTVTWAPHLYTDIGFQNHQNWCHIGGFDNYLFTPNGKTHRLLTKNAFMNLLHPFQPFILGQKTFAVKIAARFNIPLIFYGEPPGEYGGNTSIHQKKFGEEMPSDASGKESDGFRFDFVDPASTPEKIFLGGKSVASYLNDGISVGELSPYLPLDPRVISAKQIEFHYFGYYVKWVPQECYYYAVDNCGFEANPVRTEGTYSKYISLDDKTDGYFYYTQYIKFGFGRTITEASQEIRNHHITREEAVALAKKFDGELPTKYLPEFLQYLSITENEFYQTIDRFRSSKIWKKENGNWELKHRLWD